jgi:hypothetical protein
MSLEGSGGSIYETDADVASSYAYEARALREANERLLVENARLKSILADNACWMDADPVGARALPREEMLESCRRYVEQITNRCGTLRAGQVTIAQLTARVEELEAELARIKLRELPDKSIIYGGPS